MIVIQLPPVDTELYERGYSACLKDQFTDKICDLSNQLQETAYINGHILVLYGRYLE